MCRYRFVDAEMCRWFFGTSAACTTMVAGLASIAYRISLWSSTTSLAANSVDVIDAVLLIDDVSYPPNLVSIRLCNTSVFGRVNSSQMSFL